MATLMHVEDLDKATTFYAVLGFDPLLRLDRDLHLRGPRGEHLVLRQSHALVHNILRLKVEAVDMPALRSAGGREALAARYVCSELAKRVRRFVYDPSGNVVELTEPWRTSACSNARSASVSESSDERIEATASAV